MVNSGKPFEHEISKSLKAHNFHFIKIATTSAVGTSGIASRFMKSPPYDHFAVLNNRIYGIEEKSWNSYNITRVDFSRIKDHQEKGLLALESKGSNTFGVLLFNFRKPKNKAYLITINNWMLLKEKVYPKKSIPMDLLSSKPFIEIPRIRKTWIELDENENPVTKTGLLWDLTLLEGL